MGRELWNSWISGHFLVAIQLHQPAERLGLRGICPHGLTPLGKSQDRAAKACLSICNKNNSKKEHAEISPLRYPGFPVETSGLIILMRFPLLEPHPWSWQVPLTRKSGLRFGRDDKGKDRYDPKRNSRDRKTEVPFTTLRSCLLRRERL
jgi:hypothetical protein